MDFPFAKLAEDISAESPAGIDLEMEGDAEFMRFTAQIDGVLPQSFASFDRSAVDLPAQIDDVAGLLAKSKDLRLLVAAAKLFILNRDLAGFEQCVGETARWVGERWDQIFPELLDGDPILRSVALQSLDDVPHTVKPLEAAPLFKSRRAGAVSLRAALLAEGRIEPRQGENGEDEKAPTPGDIAAAIREADIGELVAARERSNRLLEALGEIESRWNEKSGAVGTLTFSNLKPKAREVAAFLERAIVSRDPSLALAPSEAEEAAAGEEAAPALVGAVKTFEDACAAMAAADRYFRRREPSSPVRLVLAQARALLGKSFYESIEQLVPDMAPRASIALGRNLPLTLPLDRLAALMAEAGEPDDDGAGEAAADDHSGYAATEGEEAEAESAEESGDGDGSAAADEEAEETGEETGEASRAVAETPPEPAGPRTFSAGSRNAALALLDQVSAFFVATEPSSAIPMVIDVAKGAAGRDFMALLRETLPASAFRVDE